MSKKYNQITISFKAEEWEQVKEHFGDKTINKCELGKKLLLIGYKTYFRKRRSKK